MESTRVIGEGRWVLGRVLGAGGSGLVYAGFDRLRGLPVAVKALRGGALDRPERIARFKHEFRALADMVHPGLVALHDLFETPELGWAFSMELVVGTSFTAWVRGEAHARAGEATLTEEAAEPRTIEAPSTVGALDPERLRDALGQLVAALAHLHQHGVVHRDLKPSNVLVSDRGRVVLLDFGLATAAAAAAVPFARGAGTPAYLAPEQFHALESVPTAAGVIGPAADAYALGVMLYESLTGGLVGADAPPPVLPLDLRDLPDARRWSSLAARLVAFDADARPDDTAIAHALGLEPTREEALEPELMRVMLDAHARVEARDHAWVSTPASPRVAATVRHFTARLSPRWTALVVRSGDREHLAYAAMDALVDQVVTTLRVRGASPTLDDDEVRALVSTFPAARSLWAHDVNARAQWVHDGSASRLGLYDPLTRALPRLVAALAPALLVVDGPAELARDDRRLWSTLFGLPGVLIVTIGSLTRAAAADLDGLVLPAGLEPTRTSISAAPSLAAQPEPDLVAACRVLMHTGLAVPEIVLVEAAGQARDGTSVAETCERLRHAGLVTRVATGVRRSARAPTGPLTRATHLTLAQAAARHAWSAPELVAEQFMRASVPGAAAPYWRRAAEQAAARGAVEHAAHAFAEALAAAPWPPRDTQALERGLGEALAADGRGVAAADAYLRAARGPDVTLGRELARRAAEALLSAGHVARGLAVLHALMRDAGLSVERRRMALAVGIGIRRGVLALSRLAQSVSGAAPGGLGVGAQVVDPERAFVVDLLASATQGIAFLDGIHATNFQTRHVHAALDLDDPPRLVRALALDLLYLASRGVDHRARSDALRLRVEALAQRLATPWARGWAAVAGGLQAFFEGEFERARASLHAAELELAGAPEHAQALVTVRVFQLWALTFEGRIAELAVESPRIARLADATGDVVLGCVARVDAASLHWLALDRPDEVHAAATRELARFAGPPPDAPHFNALMARCQAWLYQGEAPRALSALDAIWRMLARSMVLQVQCLRIEAWSMRGRAALACGQRTRAREAAELLCAESASWAHPLGRAILAGLEPALAVDHLEATARGADRHGLVLVAAAARVRLGQLGDAASGERGLTWMQAHGVVDVAAMTRVGLGAP